MIEENKGNYLAKVLDTIYEFLDMPNIYLNALLRNATLKNKLIEIKQDLAKLAQ